MRSYALTLGIFLIGTMVAAAIMLTALKAFAYHDTLVVTVNGQLLTPYQVVEAERAIGMQLRSGHYWYDEASGLWGLVGGPALGRIQAAQSAGGSGTTRSYGDGSWGYRNSTTGNGMLYDPNAGGSWQDRVWVSPD